MWWVPGFQGLGLHGIGPPLEPLGPTLGPQRIRRVMSQPAGAGDSLSRSLYQLMCSCRANSANERQPGSESGPDFQVKVLQKTLNAVLSSLGSGSNVAPSSSSVVAQSPSSTRGNLRPPKSVSSRMCVWGLCFMVLLDPSKLGLRCWI